MAAAKTQSRGRLRRSDSRSAGIHRRKRGRGFSFEDGEGTPITDEETLARIRDLAIPPAWKEVWICPDPLGHIQATGYDEAGRKQYRYHDRWDAAPRRPQVRGDARVRRRAAEAAPRRPPRHRAGRDAARARPRHRRAPARPRLLPHRQRGIRARRTRATAWRRSAASTSTATARRSSSTSRRSRHQRRIQAIGDEAAIAALETMRRRRGGPDGPARLEGGPALARRPLRPTSTTTSRTSIGDEFSAKDFRTWSGTVLAAAALAGEEKPASDAAAKRTINRAVKTVADGARQHPRGLPPLLHRPARLRPLPRRRDDRRRPPRGETRDDVGTDPAEDRARGPRADRLRRRVSRPRMG